MSEICIFKVLFTCCVKASSYTDKHLGVLFYKPLGATVEERDVFKGLRERLKDVFEQRQIFSFRIRCGNPL